MSALGHKRTSHRGPKSTFVRFGPKADKMLRRRECPLCANSGLMHRSKQHRYSITSSAIASMDA
jgi:hypothetical protein